MPWRGPEFEGDFPSLGWGVLEFIEDTLRVPDGPLVGKPLRLTDEQATLLIRFYALDPHTGRRVYRRAAVRRPKGWGKSPFLAAVSWAEFVGPVIFDGWDASGEPVGIQHGSPLVQVAAVSEDQTFNTYGALYGMASDSPAVDELRIDIGLTRIVQRDKPGRCRLMPVTASAGTREGEPTTFAVLDETHLWLPSLGGLRLAGTLRRNVAKGNGTSFESTNAHRVGEDSVAEATLLAADKGEKGLLYDAVEASLIQGSVKEASDEELMEALGDAYGDSIWVPLERLVDEIRDSATTEADARRYYLNELVADELAAFDLDAWKKLAHPEIVVADGEQITLGFDGSVRRDSTALFATSVAGGHQWEVGVWEHDGTPGWRVPHDEVTAAVAEAFDRWDVWRLYADPPYFEGPIAEWAGRHGKERVIEWWTNRTRAMASALRGWDEAIRAGTLTHDGETILTQHVGNARRHEERSRDSDGRALWTIRKDGRDSPRKIDAAMAACLSWEARSDAIAAGANKQRRKTRVYGFS